MKRERGDQGQTVVEFTLMLPFILVMLFAIVELGYALYVQVTINNAASEAARYAAVEHPSDATCGAGSVEWRATEASNGLVTQADCSSGDVEVRYQANDPGPIGRGDGVAVQINHEHQTITPLPALMSAFSFGTIDTTWTIGACSDSRLEADPGGTTTTGGDCG